MRGKRLSKRAGKRRVAIGFDFPSDWVKKRREFFFRPIVLRNNAQPITFCPESKPLLFNLRFLYN